MYIAESHTFIGGLFSVPGIEDRVRGFLEAWAKRKAGELPAIDLTVSCQRCGVQMMQGEPVAFTKAGLLCPPCSDMGGRDLIACGKPGGPF